ncbi:General transcription factor IIF subunit 2 [Hordeum vulgare]|nr:General transcription factor IIF subunit 2 [Hordeum vulgare]
MAEEGKHLETGRADRSVWLMKCPTIVSRAWQKAAAAAAAADAGGPSPNPNPVVAKVILSFDPLSTDEDPNQARASPFAPRKLACEGKVEHKFDMEPHKENLSDYAKLCRERTKNSMIKTRKVHHSRKTDRLNWSAFKSLITRNFRAYQDKKKPAPTRTPEVKRTRRDRGDIENILFKLFERQPNWSLKHLMQETDQPEQFLKEIMNDLCVYNKRGPNQGTHELKPEYKKSVEDTSAT